MIQHKDTVTHLIAATGVPAPLVISWLDPASKIAAIAYSLLGIVWLIKQLRVRR